MKNSSFKVVKHFRRKGFCIFEHVFTRAEVDLLRDEFENNQSIIAQFGNQLVNTVTSDQLIESNLSNPILRLFIDKRLNDALHPFIEATESKVLPPFELMKNFIKQRSTSGWHRDCQGEEKYPFCQNRLRSNNYFFSKVGIYLQPAGIYGGTIKVIPYSHLVFSSAISPILQKFSLGLLYLVQKSRLLRFFFELILSRDINIELGDVVVFDSRLIHAGKSLSKKVEREVRWFNDKTPILPQDKTKFVLYAHFGNAFGHDSFLYDRLRHGDEGNFKIKSELKRYAIDFQIDEKDLTDLDRVPE